MATRPIPTEAEERAAREAPSPKQSQILECIRTHMCKRGIPPTRSEIARDIGHASAAGIDHHLYALASKGWIALSPGVQRGIRLLREGTPLIDAEALERGDLDALGTKRVEGIGAVFEVRPDCLVQLSSGTTPVQGMRAGDIVAISTSRAPRDGDLVLARIHGAIELRRYVRTERAAVLKSERGTTNGAGPAPVDAEASEVEIVGVGVGAVISTTRAGTSASPATPR